MRIREITLPVRGIREPFGILHMTDSHITMADSRDRLETVRHAGERSLVFGPEGGEDVLRTFRAMIGHAEQQRLDCTVMTGDIIDFPSAKNLDILSEALAGIRVPYLYTVGNHDYENFPLETGNPETREKYRGRFDRALKTDISFSYREVGGAYIVAMDNSLYRFTGDQEARLYALAEEGKPLLLFFHIPLFAPSLFGPVMDFWHRPILCGCPDVLLENAPLPEGHPPVRPDAATARVCRWIAEHDGQVAGVFAGHIHFHHQDPLTSRLTQFSAGGGYAGDCAEIRCVPA